MIVAGIRKLRAEISNASALELATILTVLLVAFHGFKAWYFRLPAQCLVVLGIIFRAILLSWIFWLLLSVLAAGRILYFWQDVDNHKFILLYWLCCLTLAHWVSDDSLKQTLVETNARFFIVFVMLAAVAQKLASSSYMDASFFEFELLVDTRFRGFAALFGIEPDIPLQARRALELLKDPLVTVEENRIIVTTGPTLPALATFVTWYDLIIQGVIGFAFIFRTRAGDKIGHLALLTFIFTAYFAAPVIGFAWTLIIFGIVLARSQFPNLAMVYVLALLTTTLYKIPWQGWLT